MHKRILFISPILALFTLVANAQLTTVATGLNNPRGLAFGPSGILYVGEAGLGAGNGSGGAGLGQGFTGSVGEIVNHVNLSSGSPTYRRIITGLASNTDSGGVTGPDGVSPLGNGNIHIIMADSTTKILAANPSVSPNLANQFGKLLKSSQSGQWKVDANVGDFDYQWAGENKNEPWAPVGQFPDANPYAVLSVPGHQYIADAGSNTVDEVDENGSVRIIAFVPNPLLTLGDSWCRSVIPCPHAWLKDQTASSTSGLWHLERTLLPATHPNRRFTELSQPSRMQFLRIRMYGLRASTR